MKLLITILLLTITLPSIAANQSIQSIQSFSKAKKPLERQVYQDHRETLYCGAKFNAKKKVTPPKGFSTNK
jgi:deoxyribonuclease-1